MIAREILRVRGHPNPGLSGLAENVHPGFDEACVVERPRHDDDSRRSFSLDDDRGAAVGTEMPMHRLPARPARLGIGLHTSIDGDGCSWNSNQCGECRSQMSLARLAVATPDKLRLSLTCVLDLAAQASSGHSWHVVLPMLHGLDYLTCAPKAISQARVSRPISASYAAM